MIVVVTSVPTSFRMEFSTKKSKSEKFVKICLHLKVVQIGLQFGQKCQNSNFPVELRSYLIETGIGR